MKSPRLETVHGEPSLPLASDRVRAWLTPRGGMLAPVEFFLPGSRVVQPYSLAPWQPAEFLSSQPVILQVLRGDFFCFPFGADPGGVVHGPAANETWAITQADAATVELTLDCRSPRAALRKRVSLRAGETNVYQEHTICAEGRYNYGHHPILQVPEGVEALIRMSPFRFAGVYRPPEGPPAGERFALAPGARFTAMDAVPLADGGETSVARYPLRPRVEDIVMFAGFAETYAWTAVTLDGYVWFALRRTADFPGTLFWMSNGGRDGAPWNGRHVRRIGIEDVCAHFCDGPAISRRDLLASAGVITSRQFSADQPVRLAQIQGVVAVPAEFGGVAALERVPGDDRRAVLRGESGVNVPFALDWTFLDA